MRIEESFLRRRSEISATKLALLEKRLRSNSGALPDIVGRQSPDGTALLSFAQQRLWFLQQLDPECVAYNEAFAFRIQGRLNVVALTCAIREVVRRHEVLRSTTTLVDGQVIQVIDPHAHEQLPVPLIDLRDRPYEQREVAARSSIQQELQRAWNLEQELPIRVSLLCLDEQEYLSVTILHHIATDGWSKNVYYREIVLLYQAFCQAQPSPLPVLPLQYADYVSWQRQLLDTGALEHHLTYWRRQLAAPLPILDLPTDHPRPAEQTHRGQRLPISIPNDLVQQIHTLCRQGGFTLFMFLCAAFQILLYRYTRQEDIIVGTPIAGRTRPELETLLGCFVNTLALRTDLSGSPSFREVLQRVRRVTLEAYEHQELPFEKLVEDLQPERSAVHDPLFQAMFVLQNTPPVAQALPDLVLSHVEIAIESAKFDLLLNLEEKEQGLLGYIEYRTDLFEAETMQRLTSHFTRVLESMLEQEQRITDFSLLTSAEERQIAAWNDTDMAYPDTLCLHDLFEAQVRRTPGLPALTFKSVTLTYAELNERANQLAHHLRRQGVGPDTLVAICLERSLEMVVGLLGILKAGGAYLPLDPGYPKERLLFMLTDARAPYLLTQQHLLQEMPQSDARTLCLDTEWAWIAQEEKDAPISGVGPKNLAYVIYTSGSTGLPKGAMNTHEAICNRLLWMQEAYFLTAEDCVLQKTPFSFDVSVWEFFWPLITGARLVVAEPEGHRDPRYLLDIIAKEHITTLHFVPSMLQVLLEDLEAFPRPWNCGNLRQVICSGEALSYDLQERFFARMPVELHNLYGPTEAAVDVTYWKCEAHSGQVVPIGYPIDNLYIYLLDPYLQQVPVGVPGELYIGGIGLARGYHRRPALTAERFMPDPFDKRTGGRLYKTGDLARYRSDGSIEYLGRNDHQVKIRGLRVELGEIEAALCTYPHIQECSVITRTDSSNNLSLIAYIHRVVGEEGFSTPACIEYLKERLPLHMIPAAFVEVGSFPLNPSGKLDRTALSQFEVESAPWASETYVAPRTLNEKQLACIWQDILALPRVGIYDNFFEIGGHSLIVTRVLARVRDAFNIELPIRTLFKLATIAELAALIEQEQERTNANRVEKQALTSIPRAAYRQKQQALTGSLKDSTGGVKETKE